MCACKNRNTNTLDGGGFYYIALPPSRAHSIHMRIYEFRIGPGSVTYTRSDDAVAVAVGGSCHVSGYHLK